MTGWRTRTVPGSTVALLACILVVALLTLMVGAAAALPWPLLLLILAAQSMAAGGVLWYDSRLARDAMVLAENEQSLRDNNSLLAATLEATPDGIADMDRAGTIRHYNRQFARMWGIPEHGIAGIGHTDVFQAAIHQLADPAGFLGMMQGIASGEPVPPAILELKDGRLIEFAVHPRVTGGETAGYVSTYRDVTVAKRAEKTLQQANLILESSPVILFRWKAAEGWPVELVSGNVSRFGYTADDLTSGRIPYVSMVHPDDVERVAREVQEYSDAGAGSFQQEYRIVTRDGNVRWIDDRTVVERDASGRITHYQGIVMDITDRRQMEEALREREAQYRNLYETALVGIFRTSLADGRILKANQEVARMAGFAGAAEFVESGIRISDHYDPKRRAELLALLQKQGMISGFELRLTTLDGTVKDCLISARAYPDKGFLEGVIVDITDRRRMEQALKESEEKFRALAEQSQDTIMRFDAHHRHLYANPRIRDETGLSPTEVIGKTHAELGFPPGLVETWETALDTVFATRAPHRVEFQLPTGTWIDWMLVPEFDASGDVVAVMTSARDITGLKGVEEDLRENQDRLRVLLDNLQTAIILMDPATHRIAEANTVALELIGLPREEVIGKVCHRFICPAEAGRCPITDLSQRVDRSERVLLRPDGSRVPILKTVSPINFGGKSYLLESFVDISERKKAEETVRESEEKYRTLVDASIDGVIIHKDGTVAFANPAAGRLLGAGDPAALAGRRFLDFVHPAYRDVARERSARAVSEAQTPLEEIFVGADGRIVDVEVISAPLTYQGQAAVLVLFRDITERKKAREALRESEELYRNLYDTALVGLFRTSLADGTVLKANRAAARLIGYDSPEELVEARVRVSEFFPAEQRAELLRRLREHGEVSGFDEHYTFPDGTERDLSISARAFPEKGFMEGVVVDVTDRKRMELAVKENEERFRSLITTSPDIITVLDARGTIVYANPAAERILGYPLDHLTGQNPLTLIHPDDRAMVGKDLGDALQGSNDYVPTAFRFRKADGSWVYLEAIANPLKPLVGGEAGVIVTSRDITERKRVEEALRESERKYKELAELLPQAVFETDAAGNITFVNRASLAMTGYTDADVEDGVTLAQLIHPEERALALANFRKVLAGGKNLGTEYTALRKDGSPFTMIAYTSPIYRDGKPAGLRGITIDITERKKMEEALRESEKRFKEFAAMLPQAVYELDATGKVRFANQAGMVLFGYSQDDLDRGLNFGGVLAPEDRPRAIANMGRIMREGKYDSSEYTARRKDGTLFTIMTYGTPIIRDGRPAGMRGIAIDISDRKQMEEALRESESRFRELSAMLPQAVFETDRTGKITFANRAGLAMFGYGDGALEGGLTVFQIIEPGDRDRAIRNVQRVMNGEKQESAEYTAIRKDGSRFTIIVYGTPIIRDGKPAGMRGIAIDISERKQMEEALRVANRKIMLLNSTTRHDILNQVTGLLGYVALAREASSPEEYRSHLDVVEKISGRIWQQLEFTRDYQLLGVQGPSWQRVDDVFRTAVAPLDPGKVEVTADLDGVEIYADMLLHKVFYNLLENSIRHGGDGVSRVLLTQREIPEGLVLAFEDDGPGIPAREKELIFRYGHGRGTGLGLFLIQEILGITGASIRETGTEGKGVRFEILVQPGMYRFAGRNGRP